MNINVESDSDEIVSGDPPSVRPLTTADASTAVAANPTASGSETPADPAQTWVVRRESELEQQYLAPAIFELMLGRSSSDTPELIDAQIAMYGRDFAAAEALASRAVARSPWRYEGNVLAGQAAYTAGNALLDRGDYEEARHVLDRASAYYAKAIEFARSDASLYEASAQTWLQIAVIEGRRNLNSRDSLERGLEHAERALLAAPDVVAGYLLKGELLHEWSPRTALSKVLDPRIILEHEAATFSRAIEIAPGDARAWQGLGDTYGQRGIWEQVLGDRGDGQREHWWRRAIESLDHGAALQPGDPRIQSDLGWAHRFLGDALDQSARDPQPEYEAALRANKQATVIDPRDVKAWANQIDLWVTIADHLYATGSDPQSALACAQYAGERSLALDPNFHIALENLVRTDLTLVRYLLDVGGDPAVPLSRIQNHLDRFDNISPGTMQGAFYHAMVDAFVAEARVHDGLDPEAEISSARRAIADALQQ